MPCPQLPLLFLRTQLQSLYEGKAITLVVVGVYELVQKIRSDALKSWNKDRSDVQNQRALAEAVRCAVWGLTRSLSAEVRASNFVVCCLTERKVLWLSVSSRS